MIKVDFHDFVGKYKCIRIQKTGTVTTEDFLSDIQRSTTATRADGLAVLAYMQEFITKNLLAGKTVTLDGIGSFALACQIKDSSKNKDIANLNASDVELKRITFKAAPAIRDAVAEKACFRRVGKGERQAETARLGMDERRAIAVGLARKGAFMAEKYAAAANVCMSHAYRDLSTFANEGLLSVTRMHRYKMFSLPST